MLSWILATFYIDWHEVQDNLALFLLPSTPEELLCPQEVMGKNV